jgi:hypothetical protein
MSKFSLVGALRGLVCAGTALWPAAAAAQQHGSVPDFSIDDKSAWLMVGDELLPPPSGPGR